MVRMRPGAGRTERCGSGPVHLGFFAGLVLVFSVAFSACGGASAPKPQPTPAVADLLTAAADRMAAVKSLHFLLDHDNGTLPIVQNLAMKKAEGDMVLPDRMKADVDAIATSLGGVRIQVKVIAVGDTAEMTNPFNRTQWVPVPGKNPVSKIFDPASGAVKILHSVQDARVTGSEVINGIQTWKVEGTIHAIDLETFLPPAEAGYQLKGVAWIGRDDKLLYRVRLEGPAGSEDEKNVVRKLDFSKFDQPTSIELP